VIGTIIEMLVYIVLALLAVKVAFFRNAPADKKESSTTWKAALEGMAAMEERLAHIQQRDLAKQERIWKLEDENADLKARLARTTQELLLATKRDTRPSFQDDDDDIDGPIPRG
jgi:hypothetical protein